MTKDAPELGCCDLSFEGVVWAGGGGGWGKRPERESEMLCTE